MCGRYMLEVSPGELWGRFGLPGDALEDMMGDIAPRYNIAPTQQVLGVVAEEERQPRFMRWGLIPPWAKDKKIGNTMINARSETVATSRVFRSPLRRKRCLILADGFYEWRKDGKEKTPMRIMLKGGEPFAFAGLYEDWKEPEGDVVRSCTIITTTPNALLEPIHNRMPVILTPEAEDYWLDRRVDDAEALTALLVPHDPDAMEAYQIATLVNSPRNDTPEIVERLAL